VRRHLVVVDDLNHDMLKITVTLFSKVMGEDMSNTFDGPWLRARSSHSTTDHTLSLTGVQNTRQTLDGETKREVISSKERGQGAIRASAEELRAVGSRHLDKSQWVFKDAVYVLMISE
jgi:hypothetical protein